MHSTLGHRTTFVPRLWALFVQGGVFVILEGAAARLAERNALPSTLHHAVRATGSELLLGLSALIAVTLWPAVGVLGARAVLAAREHRWSLPRALARSLGGCLAVLPFLGAPLVALALADPSRTTWYAGAALAYLAVGAGLGCLLARGTAPWGERAALRVLTRAGTLLAVAALVALRAWQPEITIAPLFESTLHLRFPFEKGRPAAARAQAHAPSLPVPAVAPTSAALGLMGAMALITLGAVCFLWRTSPAEADDERAVAPPDDLWPPVIAFAGALILLVLNAHLSPALSPRSRAFALAADEACMLALLACCIAKLHALCRGPTFWPAAGGVTCMTAAAVLGLEETWLHHLPTTLTLLASVVSFAALASSIARSIESAAEPPTAWALWLFSVSLLAVALVLTDTLFQKIGGFDVEAVWRYFLYFWLVTKTTLTVLIVFIAVVLPDWVKPSPLEAAPASAPAGPA